MELSDGSIALRPWRADDAPAVFAACQDPEILHWMYALDQLQLHRLELVTDPENAASQRVAEKVGFRREGVLSHPDGRRRDSVMFSLLPCEVTQRSGGHG